MFELKIDENEMFDENTNSFFTVKSKLIKLEHSLISISKWESKWKKPFLTKENKTQEETIDYIKCMTVSQNIDDIYYDFITSSQLNKIIDYVDDPQSATLISRRNTNKPNNEQITSELLYFYMVHYNIPFECEKWHLNRLINLINICDIKNNPKKGSMKEIMGRNKRLNAQRKAKMNTRG